MSHLKILQQLRLTNRQVDDLIDWIKDDDIPPPLREQFKDFIVRNDKLIYEPMNLEYVRPRDKRQVMESLYNQVESAGKGQNNFYKWITTMYLGIKKREATTFLKSKEDYQLTRQPTYAVKKPILASYPFQIFAIDLVDMNQYIGIRENKRYRYIMSVMDLFTGYAWFKPIKKKEPEDVLNAFEIIIAESNDNIPNRLLSDNGTEFKGVFDDFLKINKITHICTKSYTPEPHIEAVNNQLRKIMRQIFVRTNSLGWLPHLRGIQLAKNSQWNLNHNTIPDNLMTRFESNEVEDKKYLRELKKSQTEFYKSRLESYEDNLLSAGDYVRVKLATRQTQIRQKIKVGNKKLVVVHWTPDVYRIQERKMPKQGRIGFPKYIVENEEGQYITKENHNYPQLFNRSDLLKVMANQRNIISQKNANTLNRLNNPEDIMVEGEQAAKEAHAVAVAIPVARAEAVAVVKPISEYKSKEWRNELVGKVFKEDNDRFKILDVSYGKRFQEYVCDVVNVKYLKTNGDIKKNHEVFQQSVKEILDLLNPAASQASNL